MCTKEEGFYLGNNYRRIRILSSVPYCCFSSTYCMVQEQIHWEELLSNTTVELASCCFSSLLHGTGVDSLEGIIVEY